MPDEINLPLRNDYLETGASSLAGCLPGSAASRVGCCSLLDSTVPCAWGAGLKPLVSLSTSSHGTVPRLPFWVPSSPCCVRKTIAY